MADYTKALKEGFEAARKADMARKEIGKVLETFKRDVLAASKGKLVIDLRTFQENLTLADSFKRALEETRRKYRALAAHNPTLEKPSFKELARWKQSSDGYPCSLILHGQERQCENRAALEIGLADLLRDPSVGETLYSLAKQSKTES